MSTHKHFDKICCVVLALVLILTVLFMNGEALGVQVESRVMGYEKKLFDTSTVHTIDIVMDDWDSFIESCTDEEYEVCSVVIDNEAYKNVAIRAKGNTSLSQVQNYGNDRYSFKIEFDHYDSTKTYYGLDKLCLNNIIQDNTYMEDYLTYQMMGYFGVDAPLCSYVYITVNGEDWGLYLAVEGVEDSFLQRNYGSDYGDLYKPDSSSMGGGRGNGKEFNMDDFSDFFGGGSSSDEDASDEDASNADDTQSSESDASGFGGGFGGGGGQMPFGGDSQFDGGEMPEGGDVPQTDDTETPQASVINATQADDAEALQEAESDADASEDDRTSGKSRGNHSGKGSDMGGGDGADMGGGGGGMSMGSDDVTLIYSDDDFDSYSNIFDNAKTTVTDSDKERLIASLKKLNENEDIEEVVNVEEVIRYFVVHNFVVNFDSYTGSMIHNYYLYEEDGQMSMIPWDYNLAFGGFQSSSDATSLVNYPIDSPVSGGTVDSRPMLAWIFANEEYTELYHEYFAEFIAEYFDSGYFESMIDSVSEMIAPYVESDPTKFCTYEEFETGVATLKEFCLLRAQSVNGQLDGTIPSTSDGQSADDSTLIDASGITISDMGSMNNSGGGGGDFGGMGGDFDSENMPDMEEVSGLISEIQSGEISEEELEEMMSSFMDMDFGGGAMPDMSGMMGGSDSSGTAAEEASEADETADGESDVSDLPDMSDGVDVASAENAGDETASGDTADGEEAGGRSDARGMGDMTDAPDMGEMGEMPEGAGSASSADAEEWIWFGASVVILVLGLVFAFAYKRRR